MIDQYRFGQNFHEPGLVKTASSQSRAPPDYAGLF